ncbi:MAG: hypothetical protein ACHRHE_14350 [Tepidisphaerales bacterium]
MTLAQSFRPLLAALLVCCAVSCTTTQPRKAPSTMATSRPIFQSVDPRAAIVRIGSWNVRWLGPSAHDRFESRAPEDLAAYIASAGVSVLALQEAGQTPGTNLRNSTLDAALAALNESSAGQWDYVLFPSQDKQQAALTGIAWDKSVVRMTDPPMALPVTLGRDDPADGTLILACPPHAAKFQPVYGSGEFVVIPIDLADNTAGSDRVAHRVGEAREIAAALPAVRNRFSSADIILLGDFAMPLSTETTGALIAECGFRDLNADDIATFATGKPYARAFVPVNSQHLAGNKSIGIFKYPVLGPDTFREKLSDSYIITVDFSKN